MPRLVLPVLAALADLAVFAVGHAGRLSPWWIGAHALATVAVLVCAWRWPAVGLVPALVLGAVDHAVWATLLWTCYRSGRSAGRAGPAVAAGALAGVLGGQLLAGRPTPAAVGQLVFSYLVFAGLPLLAGRYLRQQHQLVEALRESNRRLDRERDLIAESERLRERLRIARDMHDALGHRLSLVSVQAAALEVTGVDDRAGQLAADARRAVTELHELVGALRGQPDRHRGLGAMDELVAGFRAAGVDLTVHRSGAPVAVSALAGHAGYRIVQEGLTNAAKHAPGRPVRLALAWESDALLITVTNPADPAAAPGAALAAPPCGGPGSGGHGLAGLRERLESVGGYLDHRWQSGEFRLWAMLPAGAEPVAPPPARPVLVGLAAATALFVVLPFGLLAGSR
ncbi:hypothetical protein Lfu02_00420 [Longispora fulva]|uniref:histidine kinase n=1 Tax=Longispora fulva TaxID=619741 RepID=A0A8J7GDV1_9ACTN|nr:histidine kinase [Longispora fulva]MBG6136085.1 signal transduction histidine kinase [Longispora fulva]GIG55670.1 hypothetical protein Lfu02_00420 [Longispora fulva]